MTAPAQDQSQRRRHIRFAPDAGCFAVLNFDELTVIGLLVNESKSGCQVVIKAADITLAMGDGLRLVAGRLHAPATVVWLSPLEELVRVGLEYCDVVPT